MSKEYTGDSAENYTQTPDKTDVLFPVLRRLLEEHIDGTQDTGTSRASLLDLGCGKGDLYPLAHGLGYDYLYVLELSIRMSIAELVSGYWKKVGINTTIKNVGTNLGNIQKSSTFHVFCWALDRLHGPAFVTARGSWLNPAFWFGPIGPLWGNWLKTGGETGLNPQIT